MIGQFIALYRARKDPELAKTIASEMIVDGVLERATWPIALAKIWLCVVIAITLCIISALLALAATAHWSFAIVSLPFCGIIYAIITLWRGVNAGVEQVSNFAKAELRKRTTKPQS